MPAMIPGNFRWPPPTEEECKAISDALEKNRNRCCIRDCNEKRKDWEKGFDWKTFRIIGSAFCERHLKELIPT